jgi:phosphoglycolate phosphatase-like HAD superfamily hydrolase
VLCTSCQRPIKPVVALDVDGTMGDYHGHFLRFATHYLFDEETALKYQLSMSAIMYDGAFPFSEYVMESLKVSLDKYREIKLAYRQGGMKRTMPILPGAQALCWSIKDRGAELWITTTRPYLSLDNIVPDTVEWLHRHSIEYDGMLFDEDKYAQLKERIDGRRVVAVLDDLPEMYDAAEQVFSSHPMSAHVPILCMGQFNRAVRRTVMCDLDAAADIILARIDWWKEEYHAD